LTLNKRFMALAAVVIAQSAEASDLEKLEQRRPAFVFDSTRSVEDTAACIAKNVTVGTPTVVPERGLTRVLRYINGGLVLIYRVTSNDAGSHVEVFRALPGFGKSGLGPCMF
jgi:hypothetical protein